MKLQSFRELLVKKAEDPSLQNIIKFVRNDVLADIVVESLEKMARAKHKGDAANLAIRDFGVEMDQETEPKMIHDALSHHASRYKAALKQLDENPDNQDAKSMRDYHAGKVFGIMNMADKAQKHTGGKLRVEAVSPHAWERNAKQDKLTEDDAPVRRGNKKAGQFKTDTKGWNYTGYKDAGYGFLSQDPHPHYETETKRHGHEGAYPMEHIQVNGKYLDIDDSDNSKLNEDHPFDYHPIMSHYSTPNKGKKTDEQHQEALQNHFNSYKEAHDKYQDSPHMDKYFDKQEALEEADPKGYAARGSKPSEPIHTPKLPKESK